jgi:hypothetical protein
VSPWRSQCDSSLLPSSPWPPPHSWSHDVRLLSVEKPQVRAFYEAEALRGGWTVRQLDRQIGTQFYERTLLSRNKAAMLGEGQIARAEAALTPEEEIRDRAINGSRHSWALSANRLVST